MSVNLDLAERILNPKKSFIGAVTIFIKLLSNIIENPQQEKFKKFKRTNQRIASEMLCVDGMIELIQDAGFELDGEEFVLRRGGIGVISKLKSYRDFFQKRLDAANSVEIPVLSSTPSTSAKLKIFEQKAKPTPLLKKICASQPFHDRIRFPQLLKTSNSFLQSLEQLSDSVMQYEDELLQKSALELVPVEKFKLQAIEKLRKFQKLIKSGEINEVEPALDDLILEELADWFKNNFFTWVNSMPCSRCGNEGTDAVGIRNENGVRIERYSCTKNGCNKISEFPRYNDIAKLLVTRSGRCGEFANCFTFLCRCLGYDARYIYSTSDHVWTEVYNHSRRRWIHIDPSEENVFDSPLMYEAGWKRKLEYVLAFSRDDVQDVTWRYSSDHEGLKQRRKLCTEKELIETVLSLRGKRQAAVSAARKKFLTLRTFSELAELLIVRQPTENERKGRSSGSIAWRLQRGEAKESNHHVVTLIDEEKQRKSFNIKYSCSRDVYERSSGAISGWSSLTFASTNMFRKVEKDHKMAYLARTEGCTTGELNFKFDFFPFTIKNLAVNFNTTTFSSGEIRLELLDANEKVVVKDQLLNASKFSIRARLSGGSGDCDWQHAQIFRQSLSDKEFPFEVSVEFN